MEKNKRLRSNKDFQRVYKRGKKAWNHTFTAYCVKNKDHQSSRVGFTITKKIGNAVVRNGIKRRLKEIIRHHWEKIPKGFDIILIPKKKVEVLSYQDLEKYLLHVLTILQKVKTSC